MMFPKAGRGGDPSRQRTIYATVDTRDGRRCRCCGRTNTLSHHHIKEVSLMGLDETWNVVLLCLRCHNATQRHELLVLGNPDTRALRFEWVPLQGGTKVRTVA